MGFGLLRPRFTSLRWYFADENSSSNWTR